MVILVAPHWPSQTWFVDLMSLLDRDAVSGRGTDLASSHQELEAGSLAPGQERLLTEGLSPSVVETLQSSRAPSTLSLCSIKWKCSQSSVLLGTRTHLYVLLK